MALVNRIQELTPTRLKNAILGSPVERILAPVYFSSSEFDVFVFPTPEGDIQIELPTNVSFADVASRDELYEPELINAITDSGFSDGVFFDVGARYGFSSLAANLCGVEESNIHSFEASYLNFRVLQRNLPNSRLIHGRVGDGKDGTLNLTDYAGDSDADPDGIKIDVEGTERSVIRGLWPLIEQSMPALFIEIHPQKIGATETDELVDELFEQGYEVLMVDHHVDGDEWGEYSMTPTEEFLIWCQ